MNEIKKNTTIFDDSKKFNCKHPLTNKWVLWGDNKELNTKSDNWLDTITEIITFNTIEDFWLIFNYIKKASNLDFMSDYYIFKKNIKPMWEDIENKEGGRMTIILKKHKDYNYELLDNIWLYTILTLIGEQFNNKIINGIVLNIRKHQDRINIWTNSSNKNEIIEIGNQWKTSLKEIKYTFNISFIKHDNNTINYII